MAHGQFSAQRYERLGRTADSATLTAVTSNGSANTKGTYSTIGTAGFAYSGFYLNLRCGSGSAGTLRYRFDIAVNTGGSDVIICEDMFTATGALPSNPIWCPVRVPSGADIKARCQDSTGGSVLNMFTTGYMAGANGPPSYSRIISLTDFTNSDATNGNTLNGTTQTAWAEVDASTAQRVAGLYVSTSGRGDATRTTVNLAFEIGRGAGGSEIGMMSFGAVNNGNTNIESVVFPPVAGPFWYDIPAGTRLAVRSVASAACTDTFGVCLNGLVP